MPEQTKTGFPEEGDIVICTVTSVQYHSVFCKLDEYQKTGMIHISEVAPGRIRNIRDYVKEGKKVVCKVLKIKPDIGHIDLSLRRVTEAQKRNKVSELKQQQNAEKIVEFAAKSMGKKPEELLPKITTEAEKRGETIYEFFQEVVQDEKILAALKLPAKESAALLEAITQRVKPPQVTIQGKLSLRSYAPDGVEVIRTALDKAHQTGKDAISIHYLGSGTYKLAVTTPDYKSAEKLLSSAVDAAIKHAEKAQGSGQFARMEA